MQGTNEGFGGSGEAGGGGGRVYHFGEALRRLRHMLGYTQRQVAEHVNTHASVITKLEQRMRPPRNRVLLAKLADFYLARLKNW